MSNEVIYKERKDTNCEKWDGLETVFGQKELHAMWVADMDFEVPSCVKEALAAYAAHGVFGYYNVPDAYYEAFIRWEKNYHDYAVEKEWIRYAPGVVPGINWWIQILTQAKDSVIVLTPVYYPFLNAIKDNKRNLVTCDLINHHGNYSIDFDAFERAIVDSQVKMFILSSPHNPVGRVWKEEELRRLMEICEKHRIYVLSDEIHQDIVFTEKEQRPTAALGDYDKFLITLTAASKTFNLAACQNSFVIIPNEELRAKYDAYTSAIHFTSGNAFGYIAVRAALEKGRPWFEKVKDIIKENEVYVKTAFAQRLPEVEISPLEGTYLLWMNFAPYLKAEEIEDFMQKKCGLAFDYGHWFGGQQFGTFIRMNLATSPESVKKAVDAILANLPQ